MIVSTSYRRVVGLALATFTVALPGALAAQVPDPLANLLPARPAITLISASGAYLAARHAGAQRDSAAAAAYYRAALKADPNNSEILNRAFLSVLAGGDVEEAVQLAERLIQINRNDRIARLVLGVRALKHRRNTLARRNIAQSVRGPITDLTATLVSAWAQAGQGNTRGAVEAIDKLTGPDWYEIFKDLHAGLIYDFAGWKNSAGKRLANAYKRDGNALRVVQAYGRWASRYGAPGEAMKVYQAFNKKLPDHPLITNAMTALKAGRKLPPLVGSPQAGAGEVFYGLGASLGRRGGQDLGLVYLQLALYLAPNHSMALLSLGDLYENLKKPELAIEVYRRMPAKSPLRRNADIQLASNLNALDRPDEATKYLEKLIAEDPKDIEAIMALGNILRARKKFTECAEIYSKGIAAIADPTKPNWTIFYFRGICYERSKQWPKAEADLKKALELFPDQPHVLNYLGYSWIDQGINLDDGMKMIRRAVEQRPDDGYIVDSLGWAYFRIGNFDVAVKHLERAVELKPEDPTINDHLGDAYWRVGRTLEARFQWTHARDLKPEPDDLPKILAKLKSGLADDTPASAATAKAKKAGDGG